MGPIMAMRLTLARFEFLGFNPVAVSLAIGAATIPTGLFRQTPKTRFSANPRNDAGRVGISMC